MVDVIISNNTYAGVKLVQIPSTDGFAVFKFAYTIPEDPELPTGYTRLSTLKVSARSWFQTDTMLTAEDVLRITFKYTAFNPSSGAGTIFTDNSVNGYGLKFYGSEGKSINGYAGGTNFSGTIETAPTALTTINVYLDGAIKYDDGTNMFAPVNNGGKTSGNNFKIGEGNTTGSMIGELGAVVLIRNGKIHRAFYPCKNSNNVVGFYETKTGTFYQSAGTAYTE